MLLYYVSKNCSIYNFYESDYDAICAITFAIHPGNERMGISQLIKIVH